MGNDGTKAKTTSQKQPVAPPKQQEIVKQTQPKPEEEEDDEDEEEKEKGNSPTKTEQQSQQQPQQTQKQKPTIPLSLTSQPSPRITGPNVDKVAYAVPPDLQVMIVGLDNAGKSSILSRMKVNQMPQNIAPTAGFQIEKFQKGKTHFTVYDMAGSTSYRSLWDEHLKGCQVLVFVVDSTDRFRMVVVREELESLMELADMRGVPLLVYANKNDLPTALNYSKVTEQLGLDEISDRSWNIVSCSALTGAGISEGIDWVLQNYKPKDLK